MNCSLTPRSALQAASARLRNSGPLSRTMASGSPRSLAIRSSTRRTRNPPSEVSTSMPDIPVCNRPPWSTSESPPGGHAITHEIHRPTFIRPRGGWAGYRAPPADPPPLPNPHRQTFLAVEPVHALVVGRHSFPHQHRRQPPIPETHALRR